MGFDRNGVELKVGDYVKLVDKMNYYNSRGISYGDTGVVVGIGMDTCTVEFDKNGVVVDGMFCHRYEKIDGQAHYKVKYQLDNSLFEFEG